MTDIIEQYIEFKLHGKDTITSGDFYNIYCAVEKWHDRTPLSYHTYNSCFYLYWHYWYAILTRTRFIYHMNHGLGSISMTPILKKIDRFKIEWRKEWRKFTNYEIHSFIPPFGDGKSRYGKAAVRKWLKEVKLSNDLNWIEKFERDIDEDDY